MCELCEVVWEFQRGLWFGHLVWCGVGVLYEVVVVQAYFDVVSYVGSVGLIGLECVG